MSETAAQWATCNSCHKTMHPGGGCSFTRVSIKGKDPVQRLPNDGEHTCHDCNAGPDKLHHTGCDMERCPYCGRQIISCDCEELAWLS